MPQALPTREEIADIVELAIRMSHPRPAAEVFALVIADALLARLRPAWEPKTPEEIHKKLGAMMDEEERLMDRLEELGDTTYVVSDECVERTRKNLTVIMDLTQQRDALRADLASVTNDRNAWIRTASTIQERANTKEEALRACAEALAIAEPYVEHFPCGSKGIKESADAAIQKIRVAITRPDVQVVLNQK